MSKLRTDTVICVLPEGSAGTSGSPYIFLHNPPDYEISELFFYRYVLVFMALIGFEVTSEPSLESFGINLACFHALLAD